ncbi:23S rRNA pseudouridine(955/2504/2580) synthase RluC [Candidatus Pantoea edessiphila]|uniref:Pseudouridine synthase n=1 Tax=Candidatus Pantoea edessiphila TaxID=2044610 RepID=A0A2P5T0J3_9GAMM|nr:23S rRNA pseudouridine(955/2504/2580) synthase RluC [Candidatus Pantoea edessiphila]PPI88101.1 23S rRNA pseudouridine(955/2504/2580) synthase RluC [Candidatus Pantoea edessiphila]
MKNKFCDVQNITINNKNLNQRIDNFLSLKLKKVPKSFIYRILRKGEVRVNKKRIKPFYKLTIGDVVRIPPSYFFKENKKISLIKKNRIDFLNKIILYEDDFIIALNKPSGIAVHGGSGINFGVIEALRALRPNFSFLELVHRLDKDTSGVLLIAKKRSTLRSLHDQLRNKHVKKDYLTLVYGIWPSNLNIIKVPLVKKISKYGKFMVCADTNGKISETHFQVKEYFKYSTLMKVNPITGHTHQIRVHALHAGHPILYDKRYGNDLSDDNFMITELNRLFLHACSITFIHPQTKKSMCIKAPLDELLQRCLFNLRN